MIRKLEKVINRKNLSNLKRTSEIVWKSSAKWTISNLLLVFFQGLFPLITLYLFKLVIDSVTAGINAPDKMATFRQVALLIGAIGLVNIIMTFLSSLSNIAQEHQRIRVTEYIYDLIHQKSISVDLEYYENPQYFDSLHLAQQEAPYRPTQVINNIVQTFQNIITMLAMLGLLLSFHWIIAVILFAAVLPGIAVRIKYSGKIFFWKRTQTPSERKSYYYNWLITGESYAKEVRLYNIGRLFISRFKELRKKLRYEQLSLNKNRALADLWAQAGTVLVIFGMFGFIAFRTIRGAITIGSLVMYHQAFQRGQSALQNVLRGLANLYEDALFLNNLFEFLDLQPKIVDSAGHKTLSRQALKGIEFNGVSFQYPESTRKALEDVTFTINPGEHISLVGENGSGKTTLIKLLCRLYDPQAGSIRINGIDLKELSMQQLRSQFSVIFQDYARYHLTVRENIWLGNIDLDVDHMRIIEAARSSGSDEFILELPRGYDTYLGKWLEEGEELSVGEWQKLALARAFLRDTPFILLDEPTHSLDARAENKIYNKFIELAKDKTTIFISHRLSTARLSDRIIVLQHGSLMENGSHDELVKNNGPYAHMFELQAENYR